MRKGKTFRNGLAALCAVALVATPALTTSTAASGSTAGRTVDSSTLKQTLTVKISKKDLTVSGAKNLRAGWVGLKVKGKGSMGVVSLKNGYTFKDLNADFVAGNGGDVKALKRAFKNTEFLGGLTAGSSADTGSIRLPRPGEYTVFKFGQRKLTSPATIEAGKKVGGKPDFDATVIGASGRRWTGADQLPASGTLRLKNTDDQPHFLSMVQVVPGTTVDQVLEALQSDEQPPWVLPGELETDAVSPGRSMTADYELPPGQYVALCFVPDPTMKGMPHALMGMVKMITVA
jgi:hypothetical protein